MKRIFLLYSKEAVIEVSRLSINTKRFKRRDMGGDRIDYLSVIDRKTTAVKVVAIAIR